MTDDRAAPRRTDEDQGGTRGATAEELKGISAVPTEGGEDGKGSGAHPKETPGDEVDPGVG